MFRSLSATHFSTGCWDFVLSTAGAFTGYRGIARDVTERVLAEQHARAADERLRLAIEHLAESIAITDAEDRIVVANRYFRELNNNTRLVEPGAGAGLGSSS